MPDPVRNTTIERAVRRRHARLTEDLLQLRGDAGMSRRALASASGVSRRYLDRIEAGDASPSIETWQRLATALGADLSTRIYPNTGPRLRDRWAAPMVECVLATRHVRWDPALEALVTRPVRGWIDVVLHEAREQVLLASELQSELRRLEQQVRWHAAKAQALPSWEGFAPMGDSRISQLLVVRRTRATRAVASEFSRQLRAAYPAHPDDALAALTGTEPWPGAALVWMVIEGTRARWVSGR